MPSEAAIKRALTLATSIVIDIPERRGASQSAYVSYAMLDRLSDALVACGIDIADGRTRAKALRERIQPGGQDGKAKDD